MTHLLEPTIDNYNPMNDVLFKFIFGKEERKQITIDFLNAVLGSSLGHDIQDLAFRNTELVPASIDDKLGRLDVSCVLDTGEHIDVEVQVVNRHDMDKRTLFYWALMYAGSVEAGASYRDLKPAITVNILRFNLLTDEPEPHNMYSIYNSRSHNRLNREMELHFLEIPKFLNNPKPISEMSPMERWLAYFANKCTIAEKEELKMSSAAISEAMDAARKFIANTNDRYTYINREMALLDYNYDMESAKLSAKLSTYRELLDAGLTTIEQIKEKNLLTPSELAALS